MNKLEELLELHEKLGEAYEQKIKILEKQNRELKSYIVELEVLTLKRDVIMNDIYRMRLLNTRPSYLPYNGEYIAPLITIL